MEQAVTILRMFDRVTTEIMGENSVSLSKMGVSIRSLKYQIISKKSNDTFSGEIELEMELDSRFLIF